MKTPECKSILKYLWIFLYLFSFLGLFFYVREIFIKFKFEPDIMVTEKLIPTEMIPSSAITICTPLLTKKRKIDLKPLFKNPSLLSGNESEKCFVPFAGSCYTESLPKEVTEIDYELLDECLPSYDETLTSCLIPFISKCGESLA